MPFNGRFHKLANINLRQFAIFLSFLKILATFPDFIWCMLDTCIRQPWIEPSRSQEHWTRTSHFYWLSKISNFFFFLDKYTHIIKVKWKQIIHTWISSIDMKGFQNSLLVHYKMNFLLIFLTDKTSVRMESIYKTYKIWHFHST